VPLAPVRELSSDSRGLRKGHEFGAPASQDAVHHVSVTQSLDQQVLLLNCGMWPALLYLSYAWLYTDRLLHL